MRRPGRLFGALALAGAAACSRGPIAELEVAPASVRLDYPRVAPVVFTWRLIAPAPKGEGLLAFVHLEDGKGKVVRTFDHALPGTWSEGATIRDEVLLYQSALGPPLEPGAYRLVAGLYDRSGRHELGGSAERVRQGEYEVGRVEVGPPSAQSGAPELTFSESWWPVEPGSDAQILGRRWLADTGALRVSGTDEAGTLWLRFELPTPGAAGIGSVGSVGEAAANLPTLRIVNACAGAVVDIAGVGAHDVRLAVPAGAASAGCEVQFQPNLTVPAPGETRSRSASLQILSWGAHDPSLAPPAPAAPSSTLPPPPAPPAAPSSHTA